MLGALLGALACGRPLRPAPTVSLVEAPVASAGPSLSPVASASASAVLLPPDEWGDVYRGISYPDPRSATRQAFSAADCTGAAFTLYDAGRLCPCILREQWFDFAWWSDEPFCPSAVLRFERSADFAVSFELLADEIRGGEELRGRLVFTNRSAEPKPLVLYRETPLMLSLLGADRRPLPIAGRPCSVLVDLMGVLPRGLGIVLTPGGSLVADGSIVARRERFADRPCRLESAGPLARGSYFVSIVPDLLHDPLRPGELPFRVK